MHVLSANQVDRRLVELPGWERQGDTIEKTYTFEKFMESVAFVNEVARVANHFDHHPDIDIRFKQVRLSFTTWDEGGLTEQDFEMAYRCERVHQLEDWE